MPSEIVYFSSQSNNTHRFVQRLGLKAKRIPISPKEEDPEVDAPFVLITPTFAGADGKGAVPKQVVRFLNEQKNRDLLCGVIAGGNTNFGRMYGIGGRRVAEKCNVPLLYRFELLGTDEDVQHVKHGMETEEWNSLEK
jgi:protein involved in ribonucleotide reduction